MIIIIIIIIIIVIIIIIIIVITRCMNHFRMTFLCLYCHNKNTTTNNIILIIIIIIIIIVIINMKSPCKRQVDVGFGSISLFQLHSSFGSSTKHGQRKKLGR